MKIHFNNRLGAGLFLLLTVTFVVGVIGTMLVYSIKGGVDKVRTIEERRNRQITNEIDEANEPKFNTWLMSPPAGSTNTSLGNGEIIVEMSEEAASNVMATVAQYKIERADTFDAPNEQWADIGSQLPPSDIQTVKELTRLAARIEAMAQPQIPVGTSTSGFFRAVKVVSPP